MGMVCAHILYAGWRSLIPFLSLDIPEEFRLENWPCLHEAGRDAIQEMIETHRVLPIPAYDANSRLIVPAQYPRALKDAVVIVHFSLKHWAIDSVDTYVADIVNVRVVIPPNLSELNSPRKRKIAVTDPFNSGPSSPSPSKKTRPTWWSWIAMDIFLYCSSDTFHLVS